MNEIPAGSVTIADLFRVMTEMRNDVGNALTRLEVISSRNQAADQLHRDHETRIRAIESWRWRAAGAATAAGLLAGGLGSWAGLILSRK